MSTPGPLRLTGLKAHHPLGFLAACGLLRCCHLADKPRNPMLGWEQRPQGADWYAILATCDDSALDATLSMLTSRAAQQQDSPALKWSDKIDDRKKFREAARGLPESNGPCDDETLAVFAALGSDAVGGPEDTLASTALDLTSGNQRFLGSVRDLAKELSAQPGRSHQGPSPADSFKEALFGPWQYRDDAHSLGWDPQTQRLHALRHRLPEQDKASRSVRAAVFLATQALPLFPCFAVGGRLRTLGFHRDGREEWFAWPIWRTPVSLDTLRSLLAHPLNCDLRRRGVEMVYRCRRMRTGGSEGNYQVFSHPELRPWPTEGRRRHA